MTEVEIREYLQNYRDRKTIADYKEGRQGRGVHPGNRELYAVTAGRTRGYSSDALYREKILAEDRSGAFLLQGHYCQAQGRSNSPYGRVFGERMKKAGRSILLAFFMVDYPLQKVVIINCAGCHF